MGRRILCEFYNAKNNQLKKKITEENTNVSTPSAKTTSQTKTF